MGCNHMLGLLKQYSCVFIMKIVLMLLLHSLRRKSSFFENVCDIIYRLSSVLASPNSVFVSFARYNSKHKAM
jgi:hypothetical protein